ncbi:DUF6455 family protein [Rhodovulum sp. YNF3179]|uniref:DUF6455 family protein n=1 Tax=Rhodovulum sp. YNF3179 TaxID=3425127 RepID=UPI003D355BCA
MFNLSKLDRHEKLVDRMAETQGIDIGEEMMRGHLSANDLRSAVFSCTACTHADDCVHWLEDHKDGASQTPDYCRNAGLFRALREA